MSSRILLCAVAASVFTLLPACSHGGDPGDELGAQAGEIRGDDIASKTIVKGTLHEGGSVTIAYDPTEPYYALVNGVPFLGVELLPASADTADTARVAQPQSLMVSVSGDFPGEPSVLVVDESFRVLAQAQAPSPEEAQLVSLRVPVSPHRRFVLVRDMRWVEPMEFEIATMPE